MRGKIFVLSLVFLLVLVSLGYGDWETLYDYNEANCTGVQGGWQAGLRSLSDTVNHCCEPDSLAAGASSGDLAKNHSESLTNTWLCNEREWLSAASEAFKIKPVIRGWDGINLIKYDLVSNSKQWFMAALPAQFSTSGSPKILPIPAGGTTTENLRKSAKFLATELNGEAKILECCDNAHASGDPRICDNSISDFTDGFPRTRAPGSPTDLVADEFENGKSYSTTDFEKYFTPEIFLDLNNWNGFTHLIVFWNVSQNFDVYIRIYGGGMDNILFDDKLINYALNTPRLKEWVISGIPIQEWNNAEKILFYFKTEPEATVNNNIKIGKVFLQGDELPYFCSDEIRKAGVLDSPWINNLDDLRVGSKLKSGAPDPQPAGKTACEGLGLSWTGGGCCGNEVIEQLSGSQNPPQISLPEYLPGREGACWNNQILKNNSPVMDIEFNVTYKPTKNEIQREESKFRYQLGWQEHLEIYNQWSYSHYTRGADISRVVRVFCCPDGYYAENFQMKAGLCTNFLGDCNSPNEIRRMAEEDNECYWVRLKSENTAGRKEFIVDTRLDCTAFSKEWLGTWFSTWRETAPFYNTIGGPYKIYETPITTNTRGNNGTQDICVEGQFEGYLDIPYEIDCSPEKLNIIQGSCSIEWQEYSPGGGTESVICSGGTLGTTTVGGKIRFVCLADNNVCPVYNSDYTINISWKCCESQGSSLYGQPTFLTIDQSENPKTLIENLAEFPYKIIDLEKYNKATSKTIKVQTFYNKRLTGNDENNNRVFYEYYETGDSISSAPIGNLYQNPSRVYFGSTTLDQTTNPYDSLKVSMVNPPTNQVSTPSSEVKTLHYTCSKETCDFPLPGEPPYIIENLHADVYEMYFVPSYFGASGEANLIEGRETFNEVGYIKVKKLPLRYLWQGNSLVKCGNNLPGYIENKVGIFQTYSNLFSAEQVNDTCTVRGDYFCYEQTWHNEASGIFPAKNRTDEQLALEAVNTSIEGYQAASCCPATACWNGTTCIADMSGGEIEPQYDFGCFNGEWKPVEKLYNWEGDQLGYCPRAGQCLVDLNGSTAYNSSQDYLQGNLPRCINNGDYIFDHFCQNGSWTSRTKYLVLDLLGLVNNTGDPNDYSIHCNNFSVILAGRIYNLNYFIGPYNPNTFDYDYCLASPPSVTPAYCVNNFCRLVFKEGSTTKEVFAVSLNKPINAANGFLAALGLNTDYCDNVQSGGWDKCTNNPRVWYNRDANSFMYTTASSIDMSGPSFLDVLWQWIRGVIDWITGYQPSQVNYDYNFTINTKDFNQIYLAKKPDKRVSAVMEEFASYRYILAKYENFVLNMCTYIQGRPATQLMTDSEWGVNVVCNQTGSNYDVFMDKYIEIWPDITTSLNI